MQERLPCLPGTTKEGLAGLLCSLAWSPGETGKGA